jgi:hypothetical protein
MLPSPFYAPAPQPARPREPSARLSRALRQLRVRASSLFRPRHSPLVANRPIPAPYYAPARPTKPYFATWTHPAAAVSYLSNSSSRPFLESSRAAPRNIMGSSYAPSPYKYPLPPLPVRCAAAPAERARTHIKRKRIPYDVLEKGVV